MSGRVGFVCKRSHDIVVEVEGIKDGLDLI
jgi:hypothetical protein